MKIYTVNRLSNWNTDRKRKNERLKIYNQYKEGVITYDEYVKQRKELEDKYRNDIQVFFLIYTKKLINEYER